MWKLSWKYMAKILFRWDNKKFKNEYLKKLEKSWERWKEKIVGEEKVSFFRVETLKRSNIRITNNKLHFYFCFYLIFHFLFIFILILLRVRV